MSHKLREMLVNPNKSEKQLTVWANFSHVIKVGQIAVKMGSERSK